MRIFAVFKQNVCVSTHEYHLMEGKNVISQLAGDNGKILLLPPPPTEPRRRLLEITEHFCYYPPPPLNRVGFWRSRKRLKKFNNLNLAALRQSVAVFYLSSMVHDEMSRCHSSNDIVTETQTRLPRS